VNLDQAHRHCRDVTRHHAQNFFYGIRLLPAEKRQAMCAVYAFARRVDDIGDGSLPKDEKLRLLAEARSGLESLSVDSDDPVLAALADARARFGLPVGALRDLVDGVELDVHGASFESFDELVVYCRLVAGSIGRLCVSIFGATDPDRAERLGDDLGVAMQLTNILRDVREDFERNRVYVPAEDRARFGIDGDLLAQPKATAELLRYEAARDHDWFRRGLGLLPLLDARSASCVAAMAGIYRRILMRIEAHPEEAIHHRISLPAWQKAWVAASSLAGVARG
jgi:phytoene synthase